MSNRKEIKTDGWMATYSDLVTLLLTFFVLLYSMSSLEAEKAAQVSEAMKAAFGSSGGGSDSVLEFNMESGNVPIVGKEQVTSDDAMNEEDLALLKEITEYIKENNLEGEVTIYGDRRGLNIQLKDSVLFDTGESNLKSDSKAVLNQVSDVLVKVSNDIIIEGHTDNVPINRPSIPDNWHLSSDRALSVLEYFLDTNKSLSPQKISIEAYGEYKPIAPNDTDENRAKNRRVNIIILANEKEQGNE